ncbi:MAG: ketoacyl-ACP synthase III [Phycisphaerales bacterium]|nr:ketoacyl-ACP synthase III [Planctomycetota bacterium]MCH8508910.1 ketoacyl-ACP synthase III [Phycisphaerales bacterium]
MTPRTRAVGVEIAGSGSALPEHRLTNAELETMMETSDEWILQRTGIRERRRYDTSKPYPTTELGAEALGRALADAGMRPDELGLIVCATMTADSPTPSVSCRAAATLGCGTIGAMDINAACSGFVFTISIAHELIAGGLYDSVGVIGVDTITRHCDYSTFGRGAAILFGDAGGALVLRRSDDARKGMLAQAMHSDGSGARSLYIPNGLGQIVDAEPDPRMDEKIQMNGKTVFKFAVSKFPEVIEETLDTAGLRAADIDHYVCHQANSRILESARERFGLPESKLRINIDRYGNTVAGSCPLVFDELKREGRIEEGQRVMFIAFGAGLTWGASLWQL